MNKIKWILSKRLEAFRILKLLVSRFDCIKFGKYRYVYICIIFIARSAYFCARNIEFSGPITMFIPIQWAPRCFCTFFSSAIGAEITKMQFHTVFQSLNCMSHRKNVHNQGGKYVPSYYGFKSNFPIFCRYKYVHTYTFMTQATQQYAFLS